MITCVRCGSVARSASCPHVGIQSGRKASSVADAFQTYINMVTGVTKSTQAKAAATARALLKQAGLEEVADGDQRASHQAGRRDHAMRVAPIGSCCSTS